MQSLHSTLLILKPEPETNLQQIIIQFRIAKYLTTDTFQKIFHSNLIRSNNKPLSYSSGGSATRQMVS